MIFDTKSQLLDHNHAIHPIPKGQAWNKGLTKDTDDRIVKSVQTLKRRIKSGKIIPTWKNKHLPEETRKKVSLGLKRAIQEGRAQGWQSRPIESYPEKFWKQVLNNNDIKYEFNFKVKFSELNVSKGGCYFLDFKLPKNVDLEIDGSQHQYRTESDNRRDELISSIGYKIYRISWNDINSSAGKNLMKQKIDKFLKWYNNL